MQFTKSTLLVAALLLTGGAAAQDGPLGPYTENTDRFRLTIRSKVEGMWGQYLYAAHVGAAEELIKISPESSAEFYVASAPGAPIPYFSVKPVGVLAWDLPINTPGEASAMVAASSMRFVEETADGISLAALNVGVDEKIIPQPLIGFDREGRMYAYVAGETDDDAELYYEWFVCKTTFGQDKFDTLAWVHGKNVSDDKCIEVTIVQDI